MRVILEFMNLETANQIRDPDIPFLWTGLFLNLISTERDKGRFQRNVSTVQEIDDRKGKEQDCKEFKQLLS